MALLEETYRFDYPEIPIVVIDCRVLLFQVLREYEKNIDSIPEDQNLWFKAHWATIINNPLPWITHQPSQGFYVIVVDDWKRPDSTYWRNDYTEPFGLPRYKGNRDYNNRPEYYYRIHDSVLHYLSTQDQIPLFRQEGFEADDWAGLIARETDGSNPIFLNTVDNDWLQLVDDEKRVLFACSGFYKPRLRSEKEAIAWCLKKGYVANSPKDIVDFKIQFGDEGDNLLPGSPRGVIDLTEPTLRPAKPDGLCLKPSKSNTNEKHWRAATQWLIQLEDHFLEEKYAANIFPKSSET